MRPHAELDIECFSNWFLVGITDRASGMHWDYHMLAHVPLDLAAIVTLLKHYTIVTFNGDHYDLLMLTAALQGYDNAKLKQLNDSIIKGGKRSWENRKAFGLYAPDYIDHIDIMEVLPGVGVGLKVYAGRAHAPLILDSPVDFDSPMPFDQIPHETYYCQNDREVTGLLREQASERLRLRQALSTRYQVDVRSKSDAQIAEAVVKAEWQKRVYDAIKAGADPGCNIDWDRNGNPQIVRRFVADGYSFKYEPPEYLQFVSPHLKELLHTCATVNFIVRDKEQLVPMWVINEDDQLVLDVPKIRTGVQMPKELHKVITIAGKGYQMGIGGLHSREKKTAHVTTPGVCQMMTADVASYYPSLMVTLGMVPESIGPLFIPIFVDLKNERISAKAAAAKIKKLAKLSSEQEAYLAELLATEGGLKIVLNGTFGKLWSKYSIFFAPELGVRVTITGQLALLMLIERMELAGIAVVSANTDGIELKVPEGSMFAAETILHWWQKTTGLVMETELYRSLNSRDVNNYIAVYDGGKTKRKGVYRPSGLVENKNPNADICADAVALQLACGTPVETTIRQCTDPRKFVVVRKVKGGGYYQGQYLGAAVRWVYAIGGEPILYENGNKVASSDGAMPLMRMDDKLPPNIDYDKYTRIAYDMLDDLGYDEIPF